MATVQALHKAVEPGQPALASYTQQRLDLAAAQGAITGYTIITATGALEAANGAFAPEVLHNRERTLALLQQFSEPFRKTGNEPRSYELWGYRLHVVYQTQCSYCAVAQHRQLGLAAASLSHGLLLVCFNRRTQPRQAVALLEELRC